MCGNHTLGSILTPGEQGSPPRVREPQVQPRRLPGVIGITPACAGTTRSTSRNSARRRDHPRVCGNHGDAGQKALRDAGSPPRVREPPFLTSHPARPAGITPACAGTTQPQRQVITQCQDHPRVCGNHSDGLVASDPVEGSPPRVREPLSPGFVGLRAAGITPACAGTTMDMAAERVHVWDHPRVCGNHTYICVNWLTPLGSPPRVREPRVDIATIGLSDRITPACAGTTDVRQYDEDEDEDHPRVCGNHGRVRYKYWEALGSPPRVREPH